MIKVYNNTRRLITFADVYSKHGEVIQRGPTLRPGQNDVSEAYFESLDLQSNWLIKLLGRNDISIDMPVKKKPLPKGDRSKGIDETKGKELVVGGALAAFSAEEITVLVSEETNVEILEGYLVGEERSDISKIVKAKIASLLKG